MPASRLFRPWWRDVRGVAALEFAFGAPVFILLLVGGVDTTRYITATRRIEAAASTIGQMIGVSTTGQLAPADLQFYEDSTMVIFPMVLQDSYQQGIAWGRDIAITVSSITFSGSAAPYVAKTSWSAGSNLRPCSVPLTAVADTATPSPGTLPTDTFGPGTLIVVDLAYTFRPMVATALLRPISITRSFYVQPRFVSSISYTGTAGATVHQC